MENDAGDDPSSEIFHRRRGGRSGSSPGGGALVRARRVFYEDKRRSNELHLGTDRTVGARKRTARESVRRAAMLGGRDARGSGHASVLLGR